MADKFIPADQKIKIKLHRVEHPYEEYVNSPLWQIIDKAVEDLVINEDIKETTDRKYIVGYLCKKISESTKSKQ